MADILERAQPGGTKTPHEIRRWAHAQFASDRAGGLDCEVILRDWLTRLSDVDSRGYEVEVVRATHLLRQIQEALQWRNNEAQCSRLWIWPNPNVGHSLLPETAHEVDLPVDSEGLDQALGAYFNREDLHHPLIDASAINAMLFAALVNHARNTRNGLAVGEVNWAYIFGGNSVLAEYGLKLSWRLIHVILKWILPPALGVFLLASDLRTAAALTFILWFIYVAFRLITLPTWWRQRSRRREIFEQNWKIIHALKAAWMSANGSTINPRRLRERVIETEQLGFVYPPALHTLIDRAVQRDPTALVTV